ncbi:hypothetical protein P1X15_17230 [Runella sp. MFBS21]|uniref:DUF6896 domain-containing protein n=1 Tax=Runella sp. MFBS21 TaxID=3034018 RepID=UPI0023F9087A|nr:hypothetical protein [Runella sp. MFBS21]MDF7819364.1 hypothetical protein [Runella sp. MFBS21]
MKKRTFNIIEEYNKALIGLIIKILKKYDITYDGKEEKPFFLERFWKLYVEKKIEKKGLFFLDDGIIEYNFHGSGCFFKNNNIEIDSNFYNKYNEFSINFGVNILWNYIERNNLLKNSDSKETISKELEELYKENQILRSSSPPFQMYYSDLDRFDFGNLDT